MATPTQSLKIILPKKVVPMPDAPDHAWYWENSPRATGDGRFYRSAYANVQQGNAPWISDAVFQELNYIYQQDKALNEMALQNYQQLSSLKDASDKVAAEQAQTVSSLSAQRDAEMARLEQAKQQQAAQIAAQQIAQQQQIAERQQTQQATLAQQQARQQEQIGAQQLATQAVSQSLRVLAGMAAQGGAPTAPLSRRQTAGLRIKPTSATGSLRIGSSGRSSGVGVNLGG